MCKNTSLNIGNDIHVVPKKMRCNSVRNLMCVGRYAEMMELSEAKWNHFEMPATEMPILCIPAECDTTNRFKQTHITQIMLSHSAGMHICCATFAGISLRLCSISLRSLRITFVAYLPTHIKSLRDFSLHYAQIIQA